mgnify:FL=1
MSGGSEALRVIGHHTDQHADDIHFLSRVEKEEDAPPSLASAYHRGSRSYPSTDPIDSGVRGRGGRHVGGREG